MIYNAEEFCDLLRKVKVSETYTTTTNEFDECMAQSNKAMLDSICQILLAVDDCKDIIEDLLLEDLKMGRMSDSQRNRLNITLEKIKARLATR